MKCPAAGAESKRGFKCLKKIRLGRQEREQLKVFSSPFVIHHFSLIIQVGFCSALNRPDLANEWNVAPGATESVLSLDSSYFQVILDSCY